MPWQFIVEIQCLGNHSPAGVRNSVKFPDNSSVQSGAIAGCGTHIISSLRRRSGPRRRATRETMLMRDMNWRYVIDEAATVPNTLNDSQSDGLAKAVSACATS